MVKRQGQKKVSEKNKKYFNLIWDFLAGRNFRQRWPLLPLLPTTKVHQKANARGEKHFVSRLQ